MRCGCWPVSSARCISVRPAIARGAQGSRAVYARRMHRVIEHIDCHLDEQLELADLATVANFSAFHFHRLFAAWMGEMLGDRVHA